MTEGQELGNRLRSEGVDVAGSHREIEDDLEEE